MNPIPTKRGKRVEQFALTGRLSAMADRLANLPKTPPDGASVVVSSILLLHSASFVWPSGFTEVHKLKAHNRAWADFEAIVQRKYASLPPEHWRPLTVQTPNGPQPAFRCKLGVEVRYEPATGHWRGYAKDGRSLYVSSPNLLAAALATLQAETHS